MTNTSIFQLFVESNTRMYSIRWYGLSRGRHCRCGYREPHIHRAFRAHPARARAARRSGSCETRAIAWSTRAPSLHRVPDRAAWPLAARRRLPTERSAQERSGAQRRPLWRPGSSCSGTRGARARAPWRASARQASGTCCAARVLRSGLRSRPSSPSPRALATRGTRRRRRPPRPTTRAPTRTRCPTRSPSHCPRPRRSTRRPHPDPSRCAAPPGNSTCSQLLHRPDSGGTRRYPAGERRGSAAAWRVARGTARATAARSCGPRAPPRGTARSCQRTCSCRRGLVSRAISGWNAVTRVYCAPGAAPDAHTEDCTTWADWASAGWPSAGTACFACALEQNSTLLAHTRNRTSCRL